VGNAGWVTLAKRRLLDYGSGDTFVLCGDGYTAGWRLAHRHRRLVAGYSVYLLYWYISTDADAEGGGREEDLEVLAQREQGANSKSAHFTCFTRTKVQILTQPLLYRRRELEARDARALAS
jgi:hypothetical protein